MHRTHLIQPISDLISYAEVTGNMHGVLHVICMHVQHRTCTCTHMYYPFSIPSISISILSHNTTHFPCHSSLPSTSHYPLSFSLLLPSPSLPSSTCGTSKQHLLGRSEARGFVKYPGSSIGAAGKSHTGWT